MPGGLSPNPPWMKHRAAGLAVQIDPWWGMASACQLCPPSVVEPGRRWTRTLARGGAGTGALGAARQGLQRSHPRDRVLCPGRSGTWSQGQPPAARLSTRSLLPRVSTALPTMPGSMLQTQTGLLALVRSANLCKKRHWSSKRIFDNVAGKC